MITPDTNGHRYVAGVDEAGRGPLAGPVVVAAVVLPDQHGIEGLDDSKRLTATTREHLFEEIISNSENHAIEVVDTEEIELLNILAATLKGMQRSVLALKPRPTLVLVDGNRAPELDMEVRTLVQGDRWVPSISAASILAKVTRDRIMMEYHEQYPHYGFNQHKGYPTPGHLETLKQHGPCPVHRRGFAPVRRLLEPDLF